MIRRWYRQPSHAPSYALLGSNAGRGRGIGEISRAHIFSKQVSFGESISLLLTSPFTTIGQTGIVIQEPRPSLLNMFLRSLQRRLAPAGGTDRTSQGS